MPIRGAFEKQGIFTSLSPPFSFLFEHLGRSLRSPFHSWQIFSTDGISAHLVVADLCWQIISAKRLNSFCHFPRQPATLPARLPEHQSTGKSENGLALLRKVFRPKKPSYPDLGCLFRRLALLRRQRRFCPAREIILQCLRRSRRRRKLSFQHGELLGRQPACRPPIRIRQICVGQIRAVKSGQR